MRHPVPAVAAEPVAPPELSAAQAEAVAAVAIDGGFACSLLFGITGSGKTEVYLALAEKALAAGKQVLVLIPEIGLTPQLVERFRCRLATPVVALHSGLNDSERLHAWLLARLGKAGVVLGTRSAVFTPLPNLGLVIVDEEHDASYKQQDGLRYHARDVAVMRASRADIPVVLGSATPSLDTLHKAREGRYRLLELNDRAASGALPHVDLLDMRRLAHNEGLSHPMLVAIRERLARGEQSLIFLNRRGFAPVLMCYDCGWIAPCPRCDARLTMHKGHNRLRCHHCGTEAPLPQQCPQCEGKRLHPLGEGTERLEQELNRQFPAARVLRIDRDTTRRKGALEASLKQVREGDADILVGTQMLAKGHDFPNITLVGVVNADQGLYGADFRSAETLMQQVVQVSGRAGRADKPGQVLIQTWHPGHPVFAALQRHDYKGFADYELEQRRAAGFPPFTYFALLRAESKEKGAALRFLNAAHERGRATVVPEVELWMPQASTMERRAGFYRAQLLVQSGDRKALHPFLDRWLDAIDTLKLARQVRWSLDVDPVDLY
jgi:primosomal protein N' (replication factor Y)